MHYLLFEARNFFGRLGQKYLEVQLFTVQEKGEIKFE